MHSILRRGHNLYIAPSTINRMHISVRLPSLGHKIGLSIANVTKYSLRFQDQRWVELKVGNSEDDQQHISDFPITKNRR